jgi:HAD superfamily hydrolase (TIGR01509 family)
MTIKALIFDFDGLILDTETPKFQVWQAIYHEHGQELAPEKWGQIVGGWGLSSFDAAEHLVELVGDGLIPEELRARHESEIDAPIRLQPVLPGVEAYLDEARRLDLRLAIASSSPHSWVEGHLMRLGMYDRFQVIICAEDVPPGRTKPNPDLFLKAVDDLQVKTSEAIVFEDSPNGVQAALAAGLFVVSVPNPLTALLKTDGADMMLHSLAQVPLDALLRQANKV